MTARKHGIELDFETADRITVTVMKEQLKYLQNEVKAFKKKKTWMHEQDFAKSELELTPSLKILIKYFGE